MKKDQNILPKRAFLNASLLLILNVYMVLNVYTGTENNAAHRLCKNVYMVLNVYTGTENNAAHRLCITVLHNVHIIDENCSRMAGKILD